ncbi:hypothetical protein KSP40_PGU013728 [Platanthera guangdongensis]|uniref:DUF538 domain-containing protein n=1 Tax=Platanthera guangdongensis TaxID=2320717 RepID=A0ABR2LS99_9ASPA
MTTLASNDGGESIAMAVGTSQDKQQRGGEILRGADLCYQHTMDLLEELGFPKGVMPLKDLVECGLVRSTGFVWMNLKAPYEHFFKGTGTRVSYAKEVTAYVEKGRMKKMTGVKSKNMLLWVPIVEMSSLNDGRKIYFKTSVGIGRSFPTSAFEEEANKGEQ